MGLGLGEEERGGVVGLSRWPPNHPPTSEKQTGEQVLFKAMALSHSPSGTNASDTAPARARVCPSSVRPSICMCLFFDDLFV